MEVDAISEHWVGQREPTHQAAGLDLGLGWARTQAWARAQAWASVWLGLGRA